MLCVRTYAHEVWSSNLGPAKSYTSLQTVRQCFNIYVSNVLCGTANSLHALD